MAPPVSPDLVAAARKGDRGAMDAVVRATYADTYTLAYRLTGNDEDARDVTQDAYLRAWRGMRRFRGDAQFSTWMYRITANCAATTLARRSRTRTDVLVDDAPFPDLRPDVDPEHLAAGGGERAVLSRAVAGLPIRLRQVLVLHDVYDLPHKAIADQLGITESAAKVRLHRARHRLHDDLTATGEAAAHGWARRSGIHRAS
jgi:RNA polymerase sigma-70 factor (ECF subfamily)